VQIALIVVTLTGGTFGAVWWVRSPKVPNVSKVSFNDAAQFIATDDFNRLSESRRKAYVLSVIEKLREKKFQDFVGMAMTRDPNRELMAKNVERLSKDAKEDIGGAFMRVFLDKFYAMTAQERDVYLLGWAMAEKFAGSRASTQPATKPAGPHLPSPAELEKAMGDFLSHQPPQTVAQMSELMNSMGKKRKMMGIKEPF
jgi:hypothetical protein